MNTDQTAAPPDTPAGKCPFQAGQFASIKELQCFANLLDVMRETSPRLSSFNLEQAQQTKSFVYYPLSSTAPAPGVSTVMHKLHSQFRLLGTRLGNLLDLDSLPAIKDEVDAFKAACNAFEKIQKESVNFDSVTESTARRNQCLSQISVHYDRAIELLDQLEMLPLRTSRETVCNVENTKFNAGSEKPRTVSIASQLWRLGEASSQGLVSQRKHGESVSDQMKNTLTTDMELFEVSINSLLKKINASCMIAKINNPAAGVIRKLADEMKKAVLEDRDYVVAYLGAGEACGFTSDILWQTLTTQIPELARSSA